MLYVILFFIIAVCVFIIHICTKSNGQLLSSPESQDLQYFVIKDSGYYVSVWPKNPKIGEYIEFEIAGITYRKNIDKYLGEFVGTLKPEPTNPYDHNAIKILAPDGHHIGYVPKSFTTNVKQSKILPCKCFCFIGKRIDNNDVKYYTDCYIKI